MPNINPDFSDPAWLARLSSVGESWPGGGGGGTATAPGAGGTPPWNLNAPPTGGQGPFGKVPGAIGLPPVYNDVAGAFPNLSGNLGQLSTNIGHELAGELDPQTIAMLQNTSAQFGVGRGVPLSPFSGAQGLRQLGLTSEAQRARGNADLLSALPTVARSLTVSPETQLDVANRNATLGAAPDPEAAAREAQRLFNEYLKRTAGGGGMSFGSGGGGAPRNQNAPGGGTPWAPFQPPAVSGGQPYVPPFTGNNINWGTGGTRAPQDLWSDFAGGFKGPEGGSVATPGGGGFNDWFNDPFIGGGGGMFGLGQPPQYPDFPEWEG